LTGLESWKGFKDRGKEWLEVHHSVGGGEHEEHPERQRSDVLLELDALVHGKQGIVLPTHTAKKLAVLDTGPTVADNGGGGMAFEHGGEVYRELLVKKDAHQPAV
jgi:hypothetical protein